MKKIVDVGRKSRGRCGLRDTSCDISTERCPTKTTASNGPRKKLYSRATVTFRSKKRTAVSTGQTSAVASTFPRSNRAASVCEKTRTDMPPHKPQKTRDFVLELRWFSHLRECEKAPDAYKWRKQKQTKKAPDAYKWRTQKQQTASTKIKIKWRIYKNKWRTSGVLGTQQQINGVHIFFS